MDKNVKIKFKAGLDRKKFFKCINNFIYNTDMDVDEYVSNDEALKRTLEKYKGTYEGVMLSHECIVLVERTMELVFFIDDEKYNDKVLIADVKGRMPGYRKYISGTITYDFTYRKNEYGPCINYDKLPKEDAEIIDKKLKALTPDIYESVEEGISTYRSYFYNLYYK